MKKKDKFDMPTLEQLRREKEYLDYRKRYLRSLSSTIFTLVVIAAVTVLIAMLWLPIMEMYGNSMEPVLAEGDIVVSLQTKRIRRGDIVGFYYGNKLLVKRCIGLPGETIDVKEDGSVYINGALLDEPYVTEKALGDCDIEFPVVIPLEQYFMMGDNRAVSLDSRNSIVGCVGLDQLSGKLLFRIWPLNKLGRIEGLT